MARTRLRLDDLLANTARAESRERVAALVLARKIRVDGAPASSPALLVDPDAEVAIAVDEPFVSRGGRKLAGALDAFGHSPSGKCCADVGAATGGFTDVLLQRGAAKVYAIDVGYGDLHWKLQRDSRVVPMYRTNARLLERLAEPVELVVVDASFISLRLLLPRIADWLTPQGEIIALVKPQFEAAREQVGSGGVVRDSAIHRAVIAGLWQWAGEQGLGPQRCVESPIAGSSGNREFFLLLQPGAAARASFEIP